jgi:gliding motility-associated-like protein
MKKLQQQIVRKAAYYFSFSSFKNLAFLVYLVSQVSGYAQTTWYSYQTGYWTDTDWRTWTTDPSGTTLINPSHLQPGASDNVVILNGRIVTIPMGTTGRTVASVTIQEGAILDITNTNGHNFGAQLNGSGILRLSTSTFPNFAAGSFVQSGGGTVEYYNIGTFTLSQITYNNLKITLNNNSDEAIFATTTNPLTLNGNLIVEKGIFRINNNSNTTALTVNFNGDITVWPNGQIGVGNINIGSAANATGRSHQVNIKGSLYNYGGTVRFTNMTAPVYTADPPGGAQAGWADVNFTNTNTNQSVICNGTTVFYRIVISKGIDQTFVLNIDADAPNRFFLYGRNDRQTSYDPQAFGPDAPNILNLNALAINSGTCRLGNYISLPALSSQYYLIDEDAALWIDAAQVRYYTSNLNCGMYIYGILKLTNNALLNMDDASASMRRGVVTREASTVYIDNSILQATLIRTSSLSGTHRGAFYVSGNSIITLSGNTSHGYHATLSMGYPDNVVNISGGTININNPTSNSTDMSPGSSGAYFSVLFGSDTKNINITGGTFNINIPNGNNAYINSTVPFYDLNVTGVNSARDLRVVQYTNPGTTTAPPTLSPQPLAVLNNLTINNNAVLNLTVPNPNVNLLAGGNFTITSAGVYTPGTNTTIFNGTSPQTFDIQGTITSNLNNLTISNASTLTLNNTNASVPIIINATLQIDNGCTLNDNGRILEVRGNIINSGTHFKPASGAGSIQLTGTAAQTISGDGTGRFNNLTLNKTGGSVSLQADITVTGDLRLANSAARLNIGSYNLLFTETGDVFDGLTGNGKNFDRNRMIQTSGLVSDAGVSKKYNNTNAFLFPVGFYDAPNTTFYYMPASIRYSIAPVTFGTVTTKPVNIRHPLLQNTNALSCYWKTSSTGFTGVTAGSVIHTYTYDPLSNDFVNGTESLYVPAAYRNGDTAQWVVINNPVLVNDGTNTINYDTAYKADGEYTAGELLAFSAVPIRYSTGVNGDWDNTATWSSEGVGGTGGASIPDANTVVVIGDESNNHTVTINQNGKVCGTLIIANGSTLDLQNYTGHNFESIPNRGIKGTGTIRIASNNYFPQGDFGDFLGENGGIVEYYTISNDITIPTTSDVTGMTLDHYCNLKLTPGNGRTITLPNNNLLIYKNLTKEGTGQVNTNNAAEHQITVNGDFNINSGIFEVRNNYIQNFSVSGNFNVNGTFRPQNGGTIVNHTLELYGDLTGSGTFDANNGGRILVYFKGDKEASIRGANKEFYSLTVNKGISQATVLNVRANITSALDPAVTLVNGTLRFKQGTLNLTVAQNFTIPVSSCLSIDSVANITLMNGANNNTLFLIGKLEMLGGTLNVGNTGNNNRNSIEYSSEGNPEMVINGGTLNINGQIKRSSFTTFGHLIYRQNNGTVNIYGKNQDNTRGKFEVCNDSSYFELTGGTINVIRGGGVTFGDVYLRPAAYNVTANGTISFVPVNINTNQTYNIDAICPLGNIMIDGLDNNDRATVSLMVNPLTMLGNFTINDNFSLFNSNNLNVSVAGDFTNNGTYNAGSNTTTIFGGNTQTATFGVATTFKKLIVDKTTGTAVTFTGNNTTITDSLIVNNGTLINAGALNIIAQGNIINNGTHASTGTGSLLLQGTKNQIIAGDGNGQFGNLTINNGADNGASLTASATINGTLTLTTGYLYINEYLLTLSSTASIGGTTGNPANKNWIRTNGVLSDAGLRKIFPATSPTSFTFPIGVDGKYTPVTYDVTFNAASPGSITIKPVNIKIPSLTNTITDELQYYWHVSSTPFGGLSSITHTYNYLQADVTGNEANYVGARFYGNSWNNFGTGVMNTTANTITLTGSYIDGEYTCGEPGNFLNKPVYYSYDLAPNITTTGADWNTAGSWAFGGHDGTPATVPPDGNPVIIKSGHRINIADDDRIAYSIQNDGILDIRSTIGHSLGHVSGNGRIIVNNTPMGQFVFPGGDFTDFMNTTGSTVEYNGSVGSHLSVISSTYYIYQNLEFTGPISKSLSNVNLLIKGNLLITGSEVNNTLYNKNITLLGNWTDNVSNGFVPGTGMVSFMGTALQTINTLNPEHFYHFKINNPAGVTLNGTAEVSGRLYLTSGRINTTDVNLLTITNTSSLAVSGGSDASFVDGPLAKIILSGQSFNFPVGNYNASAAKQARYGNIHLSNVSATNTWIARYVNTSPDPLYNTSSLQPPLNLVSSNEYWVVTRPSGNTANIRLRWDEQSGIVSVNSTRVAQWATPANRWEEVGNQVSGTMTYGTVSTTTPVSSDSYIFTLGSSGVTARITNVSPTSICNNGEIITVTVVLTGSPSWTLSYQAGSNSFTQTGISSSTYNIQLTGADFGSSGTFNIRLTAVSDAYGSGSVDETIYPVTIKETYIPDIQGVFTVGAGEVRNFYTTSHSGSTYSWNWIGNSGGTIASPSQASTDITITTPPSFPAVYQLQIAETSSNGCVASDIQSITVVSTPAPYITPRTANQCYNNVVNYSTPMIAGHSYVWTVVGGTPATGTGNTITVTWNTVGPSSVSVTETVGTYSGTDIVNVVVDPQPNTNLSVTAVTPVCYNSPAVVTVGSSQSGFNYQLRIGSINTGSPIVGNGGNISLTSNPITNNTTFNVLAYNNGCSEQLTQTTTVNILPEFTTGKIMGESSANYCYEYDPAEMSISPSGGTGTWAYQWQSSSDGITWSDISGATGASYNPDQLSLTTYFRVLVDPTGIPDCGGPVSSDTIAIGINLNCELIASFKADKINSCINDAIVFTDTSQGVTPATIYSWDFGEGATPAVAGSKGPHNVVYSTAGNKTIRLIIVSGSESDTLTREGYITVHGLPEVALTDVVFCGDGEMIFDATPDNANSVEFSTDGGSTVFYSDNVSPYQCSIPVTVGDTVNIWARPVNTIAGCTGDWDNNARGIAYPIPETPKILAEDNSYSASGYIDFVCSGETNARYYVNPIGESTYNWSIPALGFNHENTEQINVDWLVKGGSYPIRVQAMSSVGCGGAIRDTLVLVSQPYPDLGGDVVACQGENVTVSPSGTFNNYLWHDGSTGSSYTTSTAGLVHVIVTDQDGCTGSDTIMITFYSSPIVNLGHDTILCDELMLDAGDFASYQWSTGETTNPIRVYAGRQVIHVTVTDEHGCQGRDTIAIEACDPSLLKDNIPNAFTPNGDNVHDRWEIKNISLYPEASIKVYDRWGRLVFSVEKGYENNWDGTSSKGKPLPMDTYYYIIDLKSGIEPITGNVTIIR